MSTEPKIVLMDGKNEEPLRKWRATKTEAFGLPIVATSLEASTKYQITTVGDTDFTQIGAASNVVGTIFTASGAGTGTGTATPVITRYNVKAGTDSDELTFMIWNNRKCNEVVDLELKSGCTTGGDIVIKLSDIDHTITLTEQTDTDLVATAIKTALELKSEFTSVWDAKIIPAIKADGVVIRNTILSFKAKDFEKKTGAYLFTANSTGVGASITVMLYGNPATDAVSKITDGKIYIKDDQGGISSDVVTQKWASVKHLADEKFTQIGVDGGSTEVFLNLKAVNSAAAIGEIFGDTNTALTSDDKNYDKLVFKMKPPTNVSQGLRPWKLFITYNFT